MKPLTFTNNKGDFKLSQAENISSLYFPLASEIGLKSAVTPNLGGDAKINQDTFLLEPVSVDNLHNNRSTRNFGSVTIMEMSFLQQVHQHSKKPSDFPIRKKKTLLRLALCGTKLSAQQQTCR